MNVNNNFTSTLTHLGWFGGVDLGPWIMFLSKSQI